MYLRDFWSVGLIILILQITGNVEGSSNGGGTDKDMQRLLTDLVSYSHKEVRPMRNLSETLTIALSLKLHDIIDFSDHILTAKITLEQVWNNYLMRWDPDAYGGIKHTILPLNQLWVPDIAHYTSAAQNHYFDGPTVKVYYTGYQEWKTTRIIRSYCEENLFVFPNEEQQCALKFGSWTYDGLMLDVQHKAGRLPNTLETGEVEEANTTKVYKIWKVVPGIDLSEFTPSVRWNVTRTEANNNVKYYTCCPEPYMDVTFWFSFKRLGIVTSAESFTWLILTVLPILTFLVPVQTNQKVSLVAVNFLLLILVLTSSGDKGNSRLVPIKNFYLFTLFLDFFSLAGAVAVVVTFSRSSPMAKILKDALPVLTKITFVSNQNAAAAGGAVPSAGADSLNALENQSPGLECISKHLKEEEAQESTKSDWICLSTVLNRICLFVVIIMSLIGILTFLC